MATRYAYKLVAPAAVVSTVNGCLANINLGPGNLGLALGYLGEDGAAPTWDATPVAYLAHWLSWIPAQIALIDAMIAGTIPTDYINEYGQPMTAVWGVGSAPSEAGAIAAMAEVTSETTVYPSDPSDPALAYNPQGSIDQMLAGMGLGVIRPEPDDE